MRETSKVKTAVKTITYEGDKLKKTVLDTVKKASDLVGSTLGPNGKIVLIERQENLPPYTTKDGISVFNSMAFHDATAQAVLEAARDSSAKTNTEAGDGPQPLHSKVLTPFGFISMGDIKEGMTICGTNGTFQKVLGVFPKGEKEIYEVEFSDGRIAECCADHLWKVMTYYGVDKIKTTSSLMKDFKTVKNDLVKYKYYVPNTVVEFAENKAEMPLDPYLVGLLLGDGSLSDSGSIELSLGKPKEHILAKITLPEGIKYSVIYVEHKNSYRVKISGSTPDGKYMHDIIKSIGLLNTNSSTKFIPKSYLYASKESREALLQGLIDTDGHINTRDRFEYSTISQELYNDFKTLVQSLGMSTYSSILERKPGSSYSDKPIFRITELKGYLGGDKIVNISATGKYTQMQCIKVSNSDSLYLTDNFIVTHNTTTATILAESLIRHGFEYLQKNPRLSTQKIMRDLEKCLNDEITPFIKSNAVKITNENSSDLLQKVAMIATNNDEEMATSVASAFELVGHNGQMTISEVPGVSGYEVEPIKGFPIGRGFEDSCGRFLEEFINDRANYRTVLEKPNFILYNGKLNEISQIVPVLQRIINATMPEDSEQSQETVMPNVVVVAHQFSDVVRAFFANNFKNPESINIIPLITPYTTQANSQFHFLMDMRAYTGATIFDPLTKPLDKAKVSDLGSAKIEQFEFYRYRSIIVGEPDEMLVLERAEELNSQSEKAESIADAEILKERSALLTGGIAKIKVFGSSDSELKEKKHRVEDAIMAIKGALREGVLPGCAKTMLELSERIHSNETKSEAVRLILGASLRAPFIRILSNGGYKGDEIKETASKMLTGGNFLHTYDALNHKFGDAIEMGVIDSAAAVSMAIKNSLSVAKMLMGLSGIVVFKRDDQLDYNDAMNFHQEQRDVQEAEAEALMEKFSQD